MNNDSLKKLSALPPELKAKLSSPSVLGVIENLEQKYGVQLTVTFIKLVVGDLAIDELEDYLTSNFSMVAASASDIKQKFDSLLAQVISGPQLESSRPVVSGSSQTSQPMSSPFASSPKSPVQPSQSDTNNANFSFSTEDEAEVDRFNSIAGSGGGYSDFNVSADQIMAEFGYRSDDAVIAKRLKNMIIARLKDLRDELETRDAMSKNKKIGGMEFSEAEIDRILGIIRSKVGKNMPQANQPKPTVQATIAPVQPKPTKSYPREYNSSASSPKNIPTPPVVAKSNNKMLEIKIEHENGLPVIKLPADDVMLRPKPVRVMPVNGENRPEPSQPRRSYPIEAIITKKTDAPARPEPRSFPVSQPMPTVTRRQPRPKIQQSRRPSLDDVKFSPKLVSPIEELAQLTLIDWRRMGEYPALRSKKIMEKMVLLEQESYAKKIAGINAWQRNEVNKFYRLLGQMSMDSGQGIEEVIDKRLSEQKPTLSLDEFEEVMDLNKQLRF